MFNNGINFPCKVYMIDHAQGAEGAGAVSAEEAEKTAGCWPYCQIYEVTHPKKIMIIALFEMTYHFNYTIYDAFYI